MESNTAKYETICLDGTEKSIQHGAMPITHRMHLLSVKCAHNRWLARANFLLQRRLVQLLLLFLLCYVRWVIHGHELLHP